MNKKTITIIVVSVIVALVLCTLCSFITVPLILDSIFGHTEDECCAAPLSSKVCPHWPGSQQRTSIKHRKLFFDKTATNHPHTL